MTRTSPINVIRNGALDPVFRQLYGHEGTEYHRTRWTGLVDTHGRRVGDAAPRLFSAPGRTELSGNHTDHNRGRVLAAAVQLDTIAAVSPAPLAGKDMTAELVSEGYPPATVDLRRTEKVESETGRTEALIRGIAAGILKRGGRIGGFRTTTTSRVLKGSGLSSSAALEILLGSIFNELFNAGRFTPLELAQIGQEAENTYFGKPCGLMDQSACSVGGVVAIDFADPLMPVVTPLAADFGAHGYVLAVVDSRADHADLTPDYAAIPAEMKSVAAALGGDVLRDVEQEVFFTSIPALRKGVGDRAILRALHFYNENRRVGEMVESLRRGSIDGYLRGVRQSGDSSFRFLQNVFSPQHPNEQAVSLALALSERYLGDVGAVRVHGGGFAGTIQVFVPASGFAGYVTYMEQYFGRGCVVELSVRPVKAGEIVVG